MIEYGGRLRMDHEHLITVHFGEIGRKEDEKIPRAKCSQETPVPGAVYGHGNRKPCRDVLCGRN